MKLVPLLPPAVALIVSASWVGNQRQSMAALDHENITLQQHIAAARTAAEASRSMADAPDKTAKNKAPIDWRKLAGQLTDMQNGGMRDMRAMMRFQSRIQAMSCDELAAALSEIAALDLPAASRARLEQSLIAPLVQKDPEFALTHFIDRLQDPGNGSISWQLARALQEWAKKDVAKASAWFDQQVAAGAFDSKSLDGKSQARIQFEGALIKELLSADPAAAGRRLSTMPDDQRVDVILRGGAFMYGQTDDQAALAKLVRDQLPAKDQAQVFGQQASNLVSQGGYAKVTEYLDKIAATPAERTACVEQAATSKLWSNKEKLASSDLDALRTWATAQAPDTTDSVTGKVLASAMQQGSFPLQFSEAAALAVQYGKASGNDDVLGTFLESWQAHNHKEEARAMAAQIADEARRTQILKHLQ